MGLFSRLRNFGSNSTSSIIFEGLDNKSTEIHIKQFMINHAKSLISETIGKAQYQIHSCDDPKVKEVLRIINLKPNLNDTATPFWTSVVNQMFEKGECLVVIRNNMLYRAESFNVENENTVIKARKYKEVNLVGNDGVTEEIKSTIKSDDALHFILPNKKASDSIDSFYKEIDEIILSMIKSYKRGKSKKWTLRLPQANMKIQDQDGKEVSLKDYATKLVGQVNSDDDEIISLPSQINLEQLNGKDDNVKIDDYLSLVKKIGDSVAMDFKIPLDIFYGSKTDKSTGTNDFITFACLPIVKTIEDTLNAGLLDSDEYEKGARIKVNKFALLYLNILELAPAADKLRSIGFSHNDIMRSIDEPEIDEEWANRRYVTKNYMNVENEGKEEVS